MLNPTQSRLKQRKDILYRRRHGIMVIGVVTASLFVSARHIRSSFRSITEHESAVTSGLQRRIIGEAEVQEGEVRQWIPALACIQF